MAKYIGPQGEVEAIQADVDGIIEGNKINNGEWFTWGPGLQKNIIAPKYFADNYKQKYPRSTEPNNNFRPTNAA